MRLIASAIIRNEKRRYLEVWLQHLLTFCDEVRLLDDGSTDGTRELVEGMDGVEYAYHHGVPFMEFESEARNTLLHWTMMGRPDYVLSIDADEFVGDTTILRDWLVSGGAPVYSLTMREVWKVEDAKIGLRVDGLWGDRRCPILWQAPPMLKGSRWRIPHRKLACGREPLGVRGQRGIDTGVGIYHFGWTRESEREARAERYFENDGGRFHANTHLQSILYPDEQVQLKWVPWPLSIPSTVASLVAA